MVKWKSLPRGFNEHQPYVVEWLLTKEFGEGVDGEMPVFTGQTPNPAMLAEGQGRG